MRVKYLMAATLVWSCWFNGKSGAGRLASTSESQSSAPQPSAQPPIPAIPLSKLPVVQGGYEVKSDTTIGKTRYPEAHYIGWVDVDLDRHFESFEAEVAVDDRGPKDETCDFGIADEDGKVLKKIEIKPGEGPVALQVNVKRCKRLKLNSGKLGLTNQSGRWLNPRLIPDATAVSLFNAVQIQAATNATPVSPVTRAAPPPSPILSIDPDGLDEIAHSLASQVRSDPELQNSMPTLVGIARFKLIPETLDRNNAENVFETLAISLIKTKAFHVIDSVELDKALDDLKIGTTGHIDAEVARKLGGMTGAACIVVGSITYDGQMVVINTRLINTKTGAATAADRVVLKKAKP